MSTQDISRQPYAIPVGLLIGLCLLSGQALADVPAQSSNQDINQPATPVEAAQLPADATVTPEALPRANGTTANAPTAFRAGTGGSDPVAGTPPEPAGAGGQVPAVTTSPDPTGTGTDSVTSSTPPNQIDTTQTDTAQTGATQSSTATGTAVQAATDTNAPAAASTSATTTPPAASQATDSMNPGSASSALAQKDTDASSQKNLEQVFKAQEKTYSLVRKGSYSAIYDVDYSYYRNSVVDLGLDDSSGAIRFYRLENDAQHSVTNTFTFQYGVLDNLTATATLPLVVKADYGGPVDRTKAGLGDVSFGLRWEPLPLERGKLPLILFGGISTKTGDSPYEINPAVDLATGKGYYSVSAGASTRKFIDPIVLFGSVSASYGIKQDGLNQQRGSATRILEAIDPGINAGFSFGFAYSLNYDVSLTMSYSQNFATQTEFQFRQINAQTGAAEARFSRPGDQSTASLSIGMGVRVSPKTIINGSVGFGLTEDASDVSLGLSLPLDFLGFGRDVK